MFHTFQGFITYLYLVIMSCLLFNILNTQSQAAENVWSSSLGSGEVLTTHHRKNFPCYETCHIASDFDSVGAIKVLQLNDE
jgi:hypothetical protein